VSDPGAQGELTGSVGDLCRSDRHAVPLLEASDYEYGVPGRFGLARCTACDLTRTDAMAFVARKPAR
jgi:hypothetical protein